VVARRLPVGEAYFEKQDPRQIVCSGDMHESEAARFRVYDLRHTFATRAAEGGAELISLAKLLGHSDAKTTER
jgi:integrase